MTSRGNLLCHSRFSRTQVGTVYLLTFRSFSSPCWALASPYCPSPPSPHTHTVFSLAFLIAFFESSPPTINKKTRDWHRRTPVSIPLFQINSSHRREYCLSRVSLGVPLQPVCPLSCLSAMPLSLSCMGPKVAHGHGTSECPSQT